MRRRPHSAPRASAALSVCTTLLLALLASPGLAQDDELTGPRISLQEALDRTLGNSFDIQLSEQDLQLRIGSEQETRGLFDNVMFFETSFNFRQEALLSPERQGEIQRRLPLEFLSVATLDGAPGALDRVADGILGNLLNTQNDGLPVAGSLIFDECQSFQTELVVDLDNGDSITACLNSNLIVEGVVIGTDVVGNTTGAEIAELARLLAIIEANSDALQQDLLDAFSDRLRALALNLRFVAEILRTQLINIGPIPDEQQFLDLRLEYGKQFRFRTGADLTSSIVLMSNEANYAGKPLNPAFGDTFRPTNFTASIGAQLNVPLGKGRGRIATAGQETALGFAVDAERALLTHTATSEVLQTIDAYWALAAAQETLAINAASAQVQNGVLESVDALIEAGELPEVERNRVSARLAQLASQVAASRQAVVEARLALVEAMGQSARSVDEAPLAAEDLPSVEALQGDIDGWVQRGFQYRQDLAAATQTVQAADVLERAAKANARYQVDLALSVNYSGFKESFDDRLYDLGGFADAVSGRISGPSYAIGLKWALPFKNRVARGRLAQARATLDRSKITEIDIKRNIQVRVRQLTDALERAQAELAQNLRSLEYWQQTMDASVDRFEAGDITLIDTITAEQQLTQVQLAAVGAKQQIIRLVTQLQFESGQLVQLPSNMEELEPAELEVLSFDVLSGSGEAR